ncbi:MAG: hypothetical protein AAGJ35_03220 [Myxococcota bacterium]
MRYSPQTILRFLAEHYEVIKKLYDSSKKNRIITQQQIDQFNINHLITKLTDYKILRGLPNHEYHLEERYRDFIAFLISDFSLDLPAQLAKYQQSLDALFLQLQQASDLEQIILIAQKISEELAAFLAHLADNTQALVQEVDQLRNASKQHISYKQQVHKAVHLITTFLEPLNRILDTHEDAIIQIIRRMIAYTYDKSLHALDVHEETPYNELHRHQHIAEAQVQKHNNILVDNLLPLLEQIKVSNAILQGLKHLRDAYNKGQDDRYQHLLPKLHDKNQRNSPIKYTYDLAAEDAIEAFLQEKQTLIRPTTQPVESLWYFREGFYQQKLIDSLPVDNFFLWCHQTLQQQEKTDIDLHKFFKMASLLFKNQFKTNLIQARQSIQLANAHITVPHINLQQH